MVARYLRAILPILLGIVAVAMVIPIAMRFSVQEYIVSDVHQSPRAEIALVLGASVVRGAPSPVLAERADTAVALYKAGTVSKILVTGDNGALSHDEVTPVRKYLLQAGVRPEDIFLDHAGFDTYSSMYRAREVFGAHSLIITTQDFHLARSLWIARKLGLAAYGIPAGGGNSPTEYIREIPACMKAVFDVLLHRVPKYLGPAIRLSGDGQSTWY